MGSRQNQNENQNEKQGENQDEKQNENENEVFRLPADNHLLLLLFLILQTKTGSALTTDH